MIDTFAILCIIVYICTTYISQSDHDKHVIYDFIYMGYLPHCIEINAYN